MIAPAPGSPDGIWISLQNTREIAGTKTGTAPRPTKRYNPQPGKLPMAGDGFPEVANQAIAQNPGGRQLFYKIPIMQ